MFYYDSVNVFICVQLILYVTSGKINPTVVSVFLERNKVKYQSVL